ncbi:MAG TPA: radical SAM protein [Anaerolineae bacterium]|nr:radical SAM protein [Anaerolineae bacterium]
MGNITSLTVVLIKPSKYDDDGFVIRYVRGVLPSNTLACMRSLTLEFSERWEKEFGIKVRVDLYDDIVEAIPVKKLARKNKGTHKVVAAIVGVQSNQFPRASDIAINLTAMGIKTLIGGFHISGILAMFNDPTPEIRELMEKGVTIVQGEAEHVWESILYDVVQEKELPLYLASELPDISEKPIPQTDAEYLKKFALPDMGTIDCSRGCPFNCSFCTIINVQGHHMRYRSADGIIKAIRENYKNGIKQYFFTDDNFSRNPEWESIFDGLIRLREDEGLHISFMMQVDMTCNNIRNFVAKASQANCSQVFIGMESLNPKNLETVGKKQNKVENYASFVKDWHKAGVVTHAGYIIGFPYDTPESIRRDIEKLKNVIEVDQATFFILTPLPGSRDHYNMVQSGANMDPDLNKYDSFHTVTKHSLMSQVEISEAYQYAWNSFYEFDNLKKILMRAGRKSYWSIFKNLMWYKSSLLEPNHPMIAGFVRLKDRLDVRHGVRVMGFVEFYLMRVREMITGFKKRIHLFLELQELWLLTRKPDDPTFKFITDFTAVLSEAKHRFSSIDFNNSYAKYCDEMNAVILSLKEKITHYKTNHLTGKTKQRFNALIEDMNIFLDKYPLSEHYTRGVAFLTQYLTRNIHLAEEFILKQVAQRRRITNFWVLTWERVKKGKIISFSISIPKIVVNAIRDFRMSFTFAYYLINSGAKWFVPRIH